MIMKGCIVAHVLGTSAVVKKKIYCSLLKPFCIRTFSESKTKTVLCQGNVYAVPKAMGAGEGGGGSTSKIKCKHGRGGGGCGGGDARWEMGRSGANMTPKTYHVLRITLCHTICMIEKGGSGRVERGRVERGEGGGDKGRGAGGGGLDRSIDGG